MRLGNSGFTSENKIQQSIRFKGEVAKVHQHLIPRFELVKNNALGDSLDLYSMKGKGRLQYLRSQSRFLLEFTVDENPKLIARHRASFDENYELQELSVNDKPIPRILYPDMLERLSGYLERANYFWHEGIISP